MNIQGSFVYDHLSSMAPKKAGRGRGGSASGRGSSSGTQAGGRASGATSRNAQVTTKGGKQVMKTLWLPNAKQPKIIDRNLSLLSGKRWERRPSSLAKLKGKEMITDSEWADPIDLPSGWSDNDDMP